MKNFIFAMMIILGLILITSGPFSAIAEAGGSKDGHRGEFTFGKGVSRGVMDRYQYRIHDPEMFQDQDREQDRIH